MMSSIFNPAAGFGAAFQKGGLFSNLGAVGGFPGAAAGPAPPSIGQRAVAPPPAPTALGGGTPQRRAAGANTLAARGTIAGGAAAPYLATTLGGAR
jgi:hypothetical protein